MTKSVAALLLLLSGLMLTTRSTLAMQDETKQPKCKLSFAVTDVSSTPIHGVEIEVLKWTGKLESFGALCTTDAAGKASIELNYSEDYFYLKFACNGYATGQRALQLTRGGENEIGFKLSRPVQGWVKLTADGKPLAGAQFSFFEITDANKSKSYLTKEIADKFGLAMNTSDAQGRLNLPLLPTGANLFFTVVHPDYKSVKLSDIIASANQVADVNLEPGVRVTLDLGADTETKKKIEGKLAEISLLSNGKPSRDVTSLMHFFPVRDGKVAFTACPMEYDNLRFEMDDFFTSPLLLNNPILSNKELDFTDKQSASFQLALHPKAKARGRVVDADGHGMAQAYVTSSIQFAEETGPSDTEEDNTTRIYRSWIPGGNGETDAQGYYNIDLSPGKNIKLEVIQEGYFTATRIEKFMWSGDDSALPTITQLHVPILKGVIVDSESNPVIGSIVQMRHTGRGDADPIGESSAGGSFELKLSRLPYQPKGEGTLTTVFAVAFDPLTNRSGMAEVDLRDTKATENIRVEIGERPSDWPLNAVKRPLSDAKTLAAIQVAIAKQRVDFEKGTVGNIAPTLAEGTWLNTDAKSLEAFRGRYVLLDFWFIGCGPCERDFPAVNLAHKKFSDLGFSVVSVHINDQLPQDVQKFADEREMTYPIVVDNPEGSILKQYREFGVNGFPSYILIDPEGRIVHNDHVGDRSDPFEGHSLRMNKLEIIYKVIRDLAEAKSK